MLLKSRVRNTGRELYCLLFEVIQPSMEMQVCSYLLLAILYGRMLNLVNFVNYNQFAKVFCQFLRFP